MTTKVSEQTRIADERDGVDPSLLKPGAQPQEEVGGDTPQAHADPHDQPVGKQLSETGADEFYLSVTPVSSAAQLVRFCHTIQRIGAADIAYFSSSASGTAIKLTLRSRVPILEILDEMEEVEKVWEDPALKVGANWRLPTFRGLRIQHCARITLNQC